MILYTAHACRKRQIISASTSLPQLAVYSAALTRCTRPGRQPTVYRVANFVSSQNHIGKPRLNCQHLNVTFRWSNKHNVPLRRQRQRWPVGIDERSERRSSAATERSTMTPTSENFLPLTFCSRMYYLEEKLALNTYRLKRLRCCS